MDIQPDSDSSMPVCFDWLCAECASLFDSTAVLYPSETGLQTRQYHHNIEELKACVRLGCHLCTALLEKLNYSGYTEYLEKNLASVGERMVNTDHRLWAIYPVPCYKHRDPTQRYKKQIYRLDFFLDLDKSLPSWNPKSLSRSESRKASFELVPANLTLSHPLVRSHDSNTWSARSLAQVKNWIASYQQYHGSQAHQCPPSTGTVRPTRLLDVGTDDEAQVVYLRDTGSLPDHGSNIVYIVLSHCWGGTLSKKLVHESLNDFRQGIRLADLPKTFRDAIQVTRKLGVNYLWIDGLCIIQDSRSDWLAESSVMGEIYANSYVNLAAAASADSHEGLFQSRNPVTVVPCHVSASGPHQPPGEYICYSPGQFSHYVDHGPLNARAWTKQERALAPRTLHFARDQLYWQCSSIIASQCFPRGSPTGLAKYNIRAWKGILTEVTDPVELDYSWFWIVLDYCRGNLTYPGDKLVALSGFAKQWGQLRGFPSSSYLAGLWLDQLPHSLCWYTEHRGCSTRPAQYRAPTWSWASVDGHIIPSAQRPKHVWKRIKLAEIVAAQTTPSNTGLGEYGPVERGYLRIQSHMCAMETVVGIQELRDNGEAWILSLGESGEEKVRVRWDEKSKDLKPCIPDPELYLLVVLRYFAIKTEDYSYPDCLDCLVLQPCHGARGQYRRVGLLDAVGSDVTKKLIRQSGLTILEEQLYDQVDEEKRYTIEIV